MVIQKNRYFRRSRLSEAKFRQVVRYFAMDLTATDCAQLCGLSLRSVNSIYLRIRARMAEHCDALSLFVGELEADESSFGPGACAACVAVALDAKPWCSGCSSAATVFTPISCQMPPNALCRPLFGARPTLPASSTPILGAAVTPSGAWRSSMASQNNVLSAPEGNRVPLQSSQQ